MLTGAIFAGLASSTSVQAQFLSPGPLAEVHAELEGVRRCTTCHTLGTRGIDAAKCLGCHTALDERIAAEEGFHSAIESDDCASCHQDHLGRDFDVRRLDEDAFDHAVVGYELLDSHAQVDCRACHSPQNITDPLVLEIKSESGSLARTLLGLSSDCASCHVTESPHGDQFGSQTCEECHTESNWEEAPLFDHSTTAFRLDGSHVEVGCSDCHGAGETAVYRPLSFASCASCHSDPHDGAMAGDCASCHSTQAWSELDQDRLIEGFDHDRTRFPLADAHASADCAACHSPQPARTTTLHINYLPGTSGRSFPIPRSDSCSSCHQTQHVFPAAEDRWSGCADCHGEAVWAPTSFNLARHADTPFPLTGAHVATPCFMCHLDPAQGHDSFTLAAPMESCAACHVEDSPHTDPVFEQFACANCHITDDFAIAVFDHGLLPDSASEDCASCHAEDDIHGAQFDGANCASCHTTDGFSISPFPHDETRFPLDGAHESVSCASCHVADTTGRIVYRPLARECADCHGGTP